MRQGCSTGVQLQYTRVLLSLFLSCRRAGEQVKNVVKGLPAHCCHHVDSNPEVCVACTPPLPTDIKLFGCWSLAGSLV